MSPRFSIGDRVVVGAVGAGTITSIDERALHITPPGESQATIDVALDAAKEGLRPVMGRDAAEALLVQLTTRPAPRAVRRAPRLTSSRDARKLQHEHALELMQLRFRAPKRMHPHEQVFLDAIVQPLVAELALALEVHPKRVMAALRSGDPSLRPPVERPLPTPPPLQLEGAAYLRSFWLGARARIGAYPHDAEWSAVSAGAEPGAWHAYRLDTTTEEPVDPGALERAPIDGLLAVHHERSGPLDLRALELRVASWVNHSQDVAILDADALKDPDLGPEPLAERRDQHEDYGDRGACTWAWADGRFDVFVDAKPKASAILIARRIG
jgi:RNA polymerase-interacting CarD/CdnL/TRCF family regulator